jgi:hypothetical protein
VVGDDAICELMSGPHSDDTLRSGLSSYGENCTKSTCDVPMFAFFSLWLRFLVAKPNGKPNQSSNPCSTTMIESRLWLVVLQPEEHVVSSHRVRCQDHSLCRTKRFSVFALSQEQRLLFCRATCMVVGYIAADMVRMLCSVCIDMCPSKRNLRTA